MTREEIKNPVYHSLLRTVLRMINAEYYTVGDRTKCENIVEKMEDIVYEELGDECTSEFVKQMVPELNFKGIRTIGRVTKARKHMMRHIKPYEGKIIKFFFNGVHKYGVIDQVDLHAYLFRITCSGLEQDWFTDPTIIDDVEMSRFTYKTFPYTFHFNYSEQLGFSCSIEWAYGIFSSFSGGSYYTFDSVLDHAFDMIKPHDTKGYPRGNTLHVHKVGGLDGIVKYRTVGFNEKSKTLLFPVEPNDFVLLFDTLEQAMNITSQLMNDRIEKFKTESIEKYGSPEGIHKFYEKYTDLRDLYLMDSVRYKNYDIEAFRCDCKENEFTERIKCRRTGNYISKEARVWDTPEKVIIDSKEVVDILLKNSIQ